MGRYDAWPGGMRPSPTTATPGQEVNITVYLTQATTSDQPVAVGVTDPSVFTSFPKYVVVPAGSDHAMFTVWVQAGASPEPITLSAWCNGVTVYAPMAIASGDGG